MIFDTIKSQIIPLGISMMLALGYFFIPDEGRLRLLGLHLTFVVGYLMYIATLASRIKLEVPLSFRAMTSQHRLAAAQSIMENISKLFQNGDPWFCMLREKRLDELLNAFQSFANGAIEYTDDSWRGIWEALVDPKKSEFYWSIALIEHERYWEGEWADHCFRKTRGLKFKKGSKRFFLISDHLLKDEAIREKIRRYEDTTQESFVLPASTVRVERPDLLLDIGVYGNNGGGQQFSDPHGGTRLFRFCFAQSDGGGREEYMRLRAAFEDLYKLFRGPGEIYKKEYLSATS